MIHHTSMFSQLLKIFSRYEFSQLVQGRGSDYCVKGFGNWTHFVSMLFCHLAQAKSLREICNGLKCCLGRLIHLGIKKAPNKSSLSYANEHRPYELYQDLFYKTLEKVRFLLPQKKLKRPLAQPVSLRSDLSGSGEPMPRKWAEKQSYSDMKKRSFIRPG